MPFILTGSEASRCRERWRFGVTLIEVLVASGILVLLLSMTLSIVANLLRATSTASSTLGAFQEGRTAFETMTRIASQAVLATYWDYDTPTSPSHYVRASELHFFLGASSVTGLGGDSVGSALFFQAPLGRSDRSEFRGFSDLLNSVGFYIRFSESDDLPTYLAGQKSQTGAWRLWMALEPSETMQIYNVFDSMPQRESDTEWIQGMVDEPSRNHILATNVILLLIRAGYLEEDPGGAGERRSWTYVYDSRADTETMAPQVAQTHQLHSALSFTMIVLDAGVAARLRETAGGRYDLVPSDLFQQAEDYDKNLSEFVNILESNPVFLDTPAAYQVFESTVSIAASKWSR